MNTQEITTLAIQTVADTGAHGFLYALDPADDINAFDMSVNPGYIGNRKTTKAQTQAVAERLAACWNACAGMPTVDVQRLGVVARAVTAAPASVAPDLNIEVGVRRAVAKVLCIPIERVQNHMDLMADLGADSLDHVEIIMAIDDEFSVEIPLDEADKIECVQQAIDYVTRVKV